MRNGFSSRRYEVYTQIRVIKSCSHTYLTVVPAETEKRHNCHYLLTVMERRNNFKSGTYISEQTQYSRSVVFEYSSLIKGLFTLNVSVSGSGSGSVCFSGSEDSLV